MQGELGFIINIDFHRLKGNKRETKELLGGLVAFKPRTIYISSTSPNGCSVYQTQVLQMHHLNKDPFMYPMFFQEDAERGPKTKK